jgi:Flp pilus assembly protein TadG
MSLLILKKLFLFNTQLLWHAHSVSNIRCGILESATVTKNVETEIATGVMSRLAANQEGNIIAMLAAAIIPVIGLIGGGVDMSRLYLTQTRLQGACDAGALLARKTMGVGAWSTNAAEKGYEMFAQNFENGAYGSNSLTRSFSEAGGNVVGTATVRVPMALMQVLGIESKAVSVRCQAELRIPNTDVMFVLDTTGSMAGTLTGSTLTKMAGLRRAVNCFYEALAKQNITTVSPADCGETENPSATNTGAVQLRFGFVPYAVNVNVGRLLPQSYLADSWTYQSREATTSNNATIPVFGTESAPTTISTVDSTPADTNWQNTDRDIRKNGVNYFWYDRMEPGQCDNKTLPPTDTSSVTSANTLVSQSPAPPVEPNSVLTKEYVQETTTRTNSYRYHFSGDKSKTNQKGDCILQSKSTQQSNRAVKTRTQTPITWASSSSGAFSGWIYKPVTFNVKDLKDTTTAGWTYRVRLPLGPEGVLIDVDWSGCIEERQTFRGGDTDPSKEWDPIPAAALDMDIDLEPTNDPATQWGPQLNGAVYTRYLVTTNAGGVKTRSNTRTLDDVFVGRNDNIIQEGGDADCPSEARKLQSWNAAAFGQYVSNLTTAGTTYHDIGLLWGARIMSPTGIFKQLNDTPNKVIERHMVFMTDGETNAVATDYSAYGTARYDRRQTPLAAPPTNDLLNKLTDARSNALCTAIKKKNITLWVVSYGDVGTDTNKRLSACATPGKFFHATSVSSIVARFKAIAAEISALRLTE